MPANDSFSGVSNCYVFKSRLQEYAQKVGLPTPVYETIKEGPSHEPSFRSTVIINNIRYDSLPGFFNRKAAEQSAAEVALLELAKSGEVSECIAQPVHETGLCKNLLQEYAQKMNYAIPLYECRKDDSPGRMPHFTCTVEIGGIRYIGAAARTKKEAEIKAARTALLAIQSSPSESSEKADTNSQLTVIPFKKRGLETSSKPDEVNKTPKPKKARFKKKGLRRKFSKGKANHNQAENVASTQMDGIDTPSQLAMAHGQLGIDPAGGSAEYLLQNGGDPHCFHSTTPCLIQCNQSTCINLSSVNYGDITFFLNEVSGAAGFGEVDPISSHSSLGQTETSSILAGLNQPGERIQAGAD